jgi:large subunit ribosomal protein L20
MPRVRKGAATRKARKRVMKAMGGTRGQVGFQYRLAKEGLVRSQVFARIGRRQKKRQFRGMWVIRLNAACQQRGMRYSEFIHGCKKAGIELNRKMLSEIAIAEPAAFDQIVEKVRAAL